MNKKYKLKNNSVANQARKTETLTEEQVKETFAFTEFLYGLRNNAYTPLMVNSILKKNTLSPQQPSEQKVAAALISPREHEEELLGYNEYAELSNMIYKRTLLYYATLLSYNLDIECINANDIADYSTKAYKKDENIVKDFLNRFDIVGEFSEVTKQLFRQDICVCLWRGDCEKYVFQEFPQRYSVITGKWEYGNLIDIDMTYFLQAGVSLEMYPREFYIYYNRIFGGNNGEQGYNPANSTYNRDGSFAQYVQTDPYLVWGFKMDNKLATRVPFLSAMLPDVVLAPLMRELQKNVNILAASKILAGEIGIKKDNKGAAVQDSVVFNPQTLGKFLSVMKSGMSDLIQLIAAPLENIKGIEYDTKDSENLYSNYEKTLASSAGNSRLLFSTERANAVESQFLMNMDENIVRPLYKQYENFLEYTINKKTYKYKFRFKLSGFNNFLDKKNEFEKTKYWAEKGFIDLDSISHSLGMNNKYQLIRKLQEAKSHDIPGLLTILPNMFTSTGSSNEGGRPEDDGTGTDRTSDYNPSSNDNKL